MQGQEIKETRKYIKGNFNITVVIPVLDEAERKRRMGAIHKATEAILKSVPVTG